MRLQAHLDPDRIRDARAAIFTVADMFKRFRLTVRLVIQLGVVVLRLHTYLQSSSRGKAFEAKLLRGGRTLSVSAWSVTRSLIRRLVALYRHLSCRVPQRRTSSPFSTQAEDLQTDASQPMSDTAEETISRTVSGPAPTGQPRRRTSKPHGEI